MGERLRDSISFSDTASFILKGERCPFLNVNNLCDIITGMGEDCLCQICRDHPRYYEWFDGVKEGGIGFCCEEAARIILSQTAPFTFTEEEIEHEDCDEYDEELYVCLFEARETIIRLLEKEELPIEDRLETVMSFTIRLQENIDNFEYSLPDLIYKSPESKLEDKGREILVALLRTEPANEEKRNRLEAELSDFDGTLPKDFVLNDTYLRNISIYFIWRYFIKGVFDGEIISKVKLMIISLKAIICLGAIEHKRKGKLSFVDWIEIVKDYSKDIEYSSENLDMLAELAYEGWI